MAEALRKESLSAASVNGRTRSSFGEYYERTPIKQQLPIIGSRIRIRERCYDLAGRLSFKNAPGMEEDYVFTVKAYSQGLNYPLKDNNFMLCAFVSRYGDTFSRSFRATDISLGILDITYVDEEEEDEEY